MSGLNSLIIFFIFLYAKKSENGLTLRLSSGIIIGFKLSDSSINKELSSPSSSGPPIKRVSYSLGKYLLK